MFNLGVWVSTCICICTAMKASVGEKQVLGWPQAPKQQPAADILSGDEGSSQTPEHRSSDHRGFTCVVVAGWTLVQG